MIYYEKNNHNRVVWLKNFNVLTATNCTNLHELFMGFYRSKYNLTVIEEKNSCKATNCTNLHELFIGFYRSKYNLPVFEEIIRVNSCNSWLSKCLQKEIWYYFNL
jgi:hypothetical protein